MTGPKNHKTKVSHSILLRVSNIYSEGSSREEHLGLSLRQAHLHEHGGGQGARGSCPRGEVSNILILLGDLMHETLFKIRKCLNLDDIAH